MHTSKLRSCLIPSLMLAASSCAIDNAPEILAPVEEAGDQAAAIHDGDDVYRTTVSTPLGNRTVTYKLIDGKRVVGGDIVLPDLPDLGDDVVAAAPSNLPKWTGNVIPYVLDGLPAGTETYVHQAIAHYQRNTAIRFVPRGTQSNYIRISAGTVCSAQLGMGSNQSVQLAPGCGRGGAIHELAHVAGLWHEQSRPDRDTYVTINWGNILPGKEHNFYTETVDNAAGPGAYDFGSIMHYASDAFSANGLPTITKKNGDLITQQRNGLSSGDLHSLNTIYPPPVTASPAQCRTAPPRGTVRRADVAEAWEDRGSLVSLSVHASTGTAFSPPVDWKTMEGSFGATVRYAAGDFDGDGDQDLVEIRNNAGYNSIWVRKSSPGAIPPVFTSEAWLSQSGYWAASTQWLPGDFNNDGITDLASAWNDAGWSSVAVWISTGTGFANPVQWAYRDGGWDDTVKWNVGDFDGDGKDDIVAAWNSGGFNMLTVRKSTGSAFTVQHWSQYQGGWDNSTQWLVGDFDGNGTSDVASVWNNGGSAAFAVWKSTGTSFLAPQHWLSSDGGFSTSTMRWMAGDVDADGDTDIISAWNNDSMTTLTVRKSTGTTFQAGIHWGYERGGWQYSASFCAGSFNLN